MKPERPNLATSTVNLAAAIARLQLEAIKRERDDAQTQAA